MLVDDAAAAALALAERGLGGIFHVAGPERVSRLELGRAVAERCGLDPAAIEEADSPGLAGDPPRPLDLSLDTRLTAAAAGFAFKDVRMGLAGVAGPGAP